MEDLISLHLQYVHRRCFQSKISHLVQEKPGRVQYLTNNTWLDLVQNFRLGNNVHLTEWALSGCKRNQGLTISPNPMTLALFHVSHARWLLIIRVPEPLVPREWWWCCDAEETNQQWPMIISWWYVFGKCIRCFKLFSELFLLLKFQIVTYSLNCELKKVQALREAVFIGKHWFKHWLFTSLLKFNINYFFLLK